MPALVARSTEGHSRSSKVSENNAAGRNPRQLGANTQAVSIMNPDHIADILAMLIMASLVLIGFCAGVGWEKWQTDDKKTKAERDLFRRRMKDAIKRTGEWSNDI